jgi:hypothetical protein
MPNPTTDYSQGEHTAIEMPKPTAWPMVVSLGLGLVGWGFAVAAESFAVVGGFLLLVGLWKWFDILVSGTGHELVAAAQRRPMPVDAVPDKVEKAMAGYRPRLPKKRYPITSGIKGGIVGGLLMPIPAEAWSLLSGHGLWYPVNLLDGILLPGIQHYSVPELEQFKPGLFALGVFIHAVMSTVIGLVFGVLLPLIPTKWWWQLVFGGVVIPQVWTGFSGAMMGVANPALREHVDWVWFAASQFVYGIAATLVVLRTEKLDVPPAGTGKHDSDHETGPQP